jgi:hypothetical protein
MKTAMIIYSVVGVVVLIVIILLATGALSGSPKSSTLSKSNTLAGNAKNDAKTIEIISSGNRNPIDETTMSTAPTCIDMISYQSDRNPLFRQSPITSVGGPKDCTFSHNDLASGYDGDETPPNVNDIARYVWGPPPVGYMFSTTCEAVSPTPAQTERTGCSRGVNHLGEIMWYNKYGVNLGPTNHNCKTCIDLPLPSS